ncbi:tetratricopeptide repeat protein [Bradyrhizobium sp. USDA 4011]
MRRQGAARGARDPACTRLIAANPRGRDLAITYYNRALAWHNKGDLEKAKSDYDQSIAINPSFAPSYGQRAKVYLQNQAFARWPITASPSSSIPTRGTPMSIARWSMISAARTGSRRCIARMRSSSRRAQPAPIIAGPWSRSAPAISTMPRGISTARSRSRTGKPSSTRCAA